MLMTTTYTLPLWLLAGIILLAALIGAGLLWYGHVTHLTQTLTRLRDEHRQLHGALLVLRVEAGHAVRGHYDDGLNTAIRQADHVVMALPRFTDTANQDTSSRTTSALRSQARRTTPF